MKRTQESPEFIEFWCDIWRPMARHTDGRGLAREAFNKHVANGADPRDIVDGARYFMRGVKDRQYVPLSATWINRCAYEDLCEQERAYQARIAEREAQRQSDNVTPIRRGVLPDTHFSKRWEQQKVAGE